MKKWWLWLSSVRSILAFFVGGSFCFATVYGVVTGNIKLEAKDVMVIVTLVFTFYFLAKDRSKNGQQQGGGQ
jgi:hypothetical protein